MTNSILGSLIVYTILGLSLKGGAIYTFSCALGEFFYHTNIRTPQWVGYIFQRPEQHRIQSRIRQAQEQLRRSAALGLDVRNVRESAELGRAPAGSIRKRRRGSPPCSPSRTCTPRSRAPRCDDRKPRRRPLFPAHRRGRPGGFPDRALGRSALAGTEPAVYPSRDLSLIPRSMGMAYEDVSLVTAGRRPPARAGSFRRRSTMRRSRTRS